MVKLITTSVVSGSEKGESQGGVFVVDLERQHVQQIMEFESIDSAGQGRDQDCGLRGIAIDDETVYFVSSDKLLAFTSNFKLIGSWRNPYLNNAHEMSIYGRLLYITSTGYDSILAFHLDDKTFSWALHVDLDRFKFSGSIYDPMGDEGPLLLNKLHLNNVHTNDDGLYISGLKSGGMLHFNGEVINMSVTLPDGSRNAQPFRDGVLFNDSEADALRYVSRSGEEDRALKVPHYETSEIEKGGSDESTVARQGFARGLCLINERIVAAGSSPSTISVYDLKDSKTLLSVNLSRDVRNAIHGLEIWPF